MYKHKISQAPMMKKGTREFRILLRMITKHTLLYSEMQSDLAIIHSKKRDDILRVEDIELPLALQLGGSKPEEIYKAAKIAVEYPYCEINLNCGCPSDKVINRDIGVILMREPQLVSELLLAIKEAAPQKAVTLKHRIGISSKKMGIEKSSYEDLVKFVSEVDSRVKIDKYTIHARIALLDGLSPKENREIPPLKYNDVFQIKKDLPHLFIEINGGISNLQEASDALQQVDSVMIGRAFLENPYSFINIDKEIFKDETNQNNEVDIFFKYLEYIREKEETWSRPKEFAHSAMRLFKGSKNVSHFKRLLSQIKGPLVSDEMKAVYQAVLKDYL